MRSRFGEKTLACGAFEAPKRKQITIGKPISHPPLSQLSESQIFVQKSCIRRQM